MANERGISDDPEEVRRIVAWADHYHACQMCSGGPGIMCKQGATLLAAYSEFTMADSAAKALRRV